MAKLLKDVFDEHCDVVINRNTVKSILTYVDKWRHKDPGHIEFLGGNLVGVSQIMYVIGVDDVNWMDDVLKLDDPLTLKDEVSTTMRAQGLDPSFMVSGNPLNQSFIWLAHKVFIATTITPAEKEKAMIAIFNMLQYKFLSSIHYRWFRHGANEAIAMAVYESLNRKWGLKKYGTWDGLINARSKDIISKRSLWYDTITKMNDDEDVVAALNDIQGRIKSIMLNLMGRYKELRDMDARIAVTGRFTTVGDDVVLKESTNHHERIRERIKGIVPDRNNFILVNLVDALVKGVDTVNRDLLVKTLTYLSENYDGRKHKQYEEFVEDTVVYSLDLMRREKIPVSDIPAAIIKLRNMFRSSRATEKALLSVRDRAGDLVEDALKTTSKGTIASTRIGVILYIVLRSLVIS